MNIEVRPTRWPGPVLAALLVLGSASTLAQYPNVRVSDPANTDPEEVTIAVNPSNPLNLVAGANITYYYYSTDGGLSWTQGNIASQFGVWGDPCVIFDRQGYAYYGHLSDPGSGFAGGLQRIVVQRSTDLGRTWSSDAGIGYNPPRQQDKEWLAADMTNSPYRDNLYAAWTQFDSYGSANPADSSRILFSRSTDRGFTWSTPVRVSDVAGDCLDSDSTVEGAVPAVGPNGEVYVAWGGPLGIEFDRSTDGGVTFGGDTFVTGEPGGWDFNVTGIYRCNGMPETACDVSNSPYRGTVYVLWSDQRNGADDTDVFLIRSTDRGSTWGAVTRVNNDTTRRQQFFPWLSIDQTTGYLYVVFYDRRYTAGDTTEVFMAKSTDGGATFQNSRVSQLPFLPQTNVFFGDYINVAAYAGNVYPIWMRMDGRNLSVWTALVRDTVAVAVNDVGQAPDAFMLAQNYPNPFNPTTEIQFTLPAPSRVTLAVYDMLGRLVATLVDGMRPEGTQRVSWDARAYASGMYVYRLQAGRMVSSRTMVLLH